MDEYRYISITAGPMTTYIFRIVVELKLEQWSAYCPALLQHGAVAWGATRDEALRNIHALVQLIVPHLMAHGIAVPAGPTDDVEVSAESKVAVTI